MTKQPEKQPQKTRKRLRMLDEDADGVRIKVIPDFNKQLRARMTATQQLQDDFYISNRAQLMLNFLKKHGIVLFKRHEDPSIVSPVRCSLYSMY